MRLSSVRRFAAAVAWAAAAATIALLPGIGPMLDHHYAGRQPGHSHVGAMFPDHLHSHEIAYDQLNAVSADDDGEPGGMVVIAAYSGAMAAQAYVTGSASRTDLSFPDPDETQYPNTDHYRALRQQAFVTPHTQPPQV